MESGSRNVFLGKIGGEIRDRRDVPQFWKEELVTVSARPAFSNPLGTTNYLYDGDARRNKPTRPANSRSGLIVVFETRVSS